MKFTGLPGGMDMVWIFDPDEIEKVSFLHVKAIA
jgi:hypothetical protein